MSLTNSRHHCHSRTPMNFRTFFWMHRIAMSCVWRIMCTMIHTTANVVDLVCSHLDLRLFPGGTAFTARSYFDYSNGMRRKFRVQGLQRIIQYYVARCWSEIPKGRKMALNLMGGPNSFRVIQCWNDNEFTLFQILKRLMHPN